MVTSNGGDLPGAGDFEEFENSVQGVNVAADPSAVAFGGGTVGLADYPLMLPEAGLGDGLSQGGDFSFPAAGVYDATFGIADDTFGGAGYEGFSSGAGLSGIRTSGTVFGDPGDRFYASGFGDFSFPALVILCPIYHNKSRHYTFSQQLLHFLSV